MYPAKRQRIEKASAILCKPFRSPLKTRIDKHGPYFSRTQDDPSKQPISCTPQRSPPSDFTQQGCPSKVGESVTRDANLTTINDLIVLQKQYSSLAQQLRKLKQDLDVTEQALKIRCSSQADQTQEAILNWRDIARQAADDVFTISQNRINSMGGLKAWRENTIQSSQYWQRRPAVYGSAELAERDDATHTDADSTEEDNIRQLDEDQAEETEEDVSQKCAPIVNSLCSADCAVADLHYWHDVATVERRSRPTRFR